MGFDKILQNVLALFFATTFKSSIVLIGSYVPEYQVVLERVDNEKGSLLVTYPLITWIASGDSKFMTWSFPI